VGGGRLFRHLPLLVFLAVYVLSCLLGALLILGDYRPFVRLFQYFSGTKPPTLQDGELAANLWLLFAAPVALALGYVATVAVVRRRRPTFADPDAAPAVRLPASLPHALFYVLAALGTISLARAGAFDRIGSWLDYNAWIDARATNFSEISFVEFVNLYTLIPVSAALVILTTRGRSVPSQIMRWLPLLIAVGVSLMLFQKKAALATVLIAAFAWVIELIPRRARAARIVIATSTVAVAALYLTVAVVPVYSNTQQAVTTAKETAEQHPDSPPPVIPNRPSPTVTHAERRQLERDIGLHTRRGAIVLYSIISPLTRSSAPALYYPVIFPRAHPYYRVDVGLDILGSGRMPDDNIVVWNYLNPNLAGGTVMVPYQFVLYSQLGTAGAVAASVLVGILLALMWLGSQSLRIPRPWAPLLGALVLLFAAYIGIDSMRNSITVSYGVLWGGVFVAVLGGLVRLPDTIAVIRRPRARSLPPLG
jgi:hypothetical protein